MIKIKIILCFFHYLVFDVFESGLIINPHLPSTLTLAKPSMK